MRPVFIIGSGFMRLAAHIFAFFLATMSMATPCFADLVGPMQKGDKAAQTSICDGVGKQCSSKSNQAVISRAGDVEHQLVLPKIDDVPVLQLGGNHIGFDRYTAVRTTMPFDRCGAGVDLYYLCRQLN